MAHDLKTWPGEFQAVIDGRKKFEIRSNRDRWFCENDKLHLREWDADRGYTGRVTCVKVLYIISGQWGIPADLSVMSIEVDL